MYHTLSCDLADTAALERALKGVCMDPSIPTFILSECVLTYVMAEKATQVKKRGGGGRHDRPDMG